ncbi:MAG: CheR family methyltransferase [Gammaproteobacteria bacterium]
MDPLLISDTEFAQFQRFVRAATGISLSAAKKAMVSGRLMKRIKHYDLPSYGAYFKLLQSGRAAAETQTAIDLLTTNETQFFREPKHFEFLRRVLAQRTSGATLRVWSAACSSGEEPYSIAMLLADSLGQGRWEIVASDISTRVLEKARNGHYPIDRAGPIPPGYLHDYCLKGVGERAGLFSIDHRLRERVRFVSINLNAPIPAMGEFDVVFLRNVMIYFDAQTKGEVVQRVLTAVRPGGHLVIGHSESLHGINPQVAMVQPSVYRRA